MKTCIVKTQQELVIKFIIVKQNKGEMATSNIVWHMGMFRHVTHVLKEKKKRHVTQVCIHTKSSEF